MIVPALLSSGLANIFFRALLMEASSRATNCTPPTSDLCVMSGETTLMTTRPPVSLSTSAAVTFPPAGTKTVRGTDATFMAVRIA